MTVALKSKTIHANPTSSFRPLEPLKPFTGWEWKNVNFLPFRINFRNFHIWPQLTGIRGSRLRKGFPRSTAMSFRDISSELQGTRSKLLAEPATSFRMYPQRDSGSYCKRGDAHSKSPGYPHQVSGVSATDSEARGAGLRAVARASG